jgi:hypothetical protein
MKKIIPILAGLAVSAALLWLAFRKADLRAIAAVLAGVKTAPLALVALTVAGELGIRGLKWSLLLAPAKKVRAWDAARLETAALALNNLLPLRLGELARAAYGAELFKARLSTVLATILAEKALDMAALFALAGAGAAAAPGGLAVSLPGWRVALPLAAVMAALLIAARALYSRSARVKNSLDGLALGLKALRSPGAAAAVFGLALLQWFFNALNYYWLALAFGLGPAASLPRAALLSFTGAAASSAPGMPGYFGGFELAVSAVLGAWGVPRETALAYAAASHLLPYLVTTAAGLACIYGLGTSLHEVWRRFSHQQQAHGGSDI